MGQLRKPGLLRKLGVRKLGVWIAVLGILPVGATTLQQLSLPEMAQKSTTVVHARVVGAVGVLRGSDVYTVYKLEPIDVWKSPATGVPTEVAIPGGVAGGLRQPVDGAPALLQNHEYVLFLWTGKTGLTQLIGLSQGLFDVQSDVHSNDGNVFRAPASERMLDAQGRPASGTAVSMKLADLKTQVASALLSLPSRGGR
jgi:hypothetical protein